MISAPLARAASTNFFTFGTDAAHRGRRACVQVCTVKSMTRSAVVLASSVTGLSCGGAGSFALDQSSMIVVSACAGSAAASANAAAAEMKTPSKIDLRNTCSSPVSRHLTSSRCRRKAACPVLSSQRPSRYACPQKTRPRALVFTRSGPTSKVCHQNPGASVMAADQDIKTLDNSVDRRAFLGTAAASVVGLPNVAVAQQHPPAGSSPAAQSEPVSEMIADFIVGFDLKNAPPLAIERSRTAFVDAIGVMLAGSQLPPAEIVGEVVRVTASAPAATIVGRPLRAAPQLAALANGVAGHDMDFDLTYFAGQTIAGVIPAILPVAEASGATSADMLSAFIIAAEVAGRVTRAAPLAL